MSHPDNSTQTVTRGQYPECSCGLLTARAAAPGRQGARGGGPGAPGDMAAMRPAAEQLIRDLASIKCLLWPDSLTWKPAENPVGQVCPHAGTRGQGAFRACPHPPGQPYLHMSLEEALRLRAGAKRGYL